MPSALLLTDKFLPEPGGSQLYLGRIYEHLREVQARVITRSWPGARALDAGYPLPVHRVPFMDVPKVRMPLLWATLLARASLGFLSGRPDEVHCGQVLETGLAGWLLHRLTGLPYVVYTYGEELGVYAGRPSTRRWLTRVLDAAYAVVTVSQASQEALVGLGVAPGKVAVVYPGVDAAAGGPEGGAMRAGYRVGAGPLLLTVGRLSERKGQDTVLQALPQLFTAYPDLRYVIAGRGPNEARLRALVRELRLEDRVTLLTSVTETEREALYAACDLFVMPNRTLPNGDVEGFGIVFLEANAAGKAVIGGRSGGSVEAIQDGVTGLLVDPTDPAALARALHELLSDPGRRAAMGEAGRRRVQEQFSWQGAADAVTVHLAACRPIGSLSSNRP